MKEHKLFHNLTNNLEYLELLINFSRIFKKWCWKKSALLFYGSTVMENRAMQTNNLMQKSKSERQRERDYERNISRQKKNISVTFSASNKIISTILQTTDELIWFFCFQPNNEICFQLVIKLYTILKLSLLIFLNCSI